ncbi:hypothetical protein O6H91_03G105500 [Diphasiastrum complanatum]|uniref:Uncharacterized protein n=1 Tax=Diphasiastrum complanatum TaxID=34168 RepID=A0ACC2EAK9_DIPCM|nr:hypothetical protein O6H91_Y210300 [Diphasiastrum complanatum]KAJ7563312.1 hypothetical protein O6H91_03G105500 [Diphasiastrum complanatum]
MGFSNYLIGILNFATIVLSVPIIGGGIWLATKHNTDCVRFLQWPVTIIGIFILLVSIAGFVGGCFRVSSLLWIYLFVMFLLIFLLLCFTVFAFVVTNDGAGHALAGKGFREYRLEDYSTWLQKKVDDAQSWNRIRSCLADAQVCKGLNDEYPTSEAFSSAQLSPLQSGCCKPPFACKFVFENATEWDNSTNPNADPDCILWTNENLCFSCDSCRAGVLQNIKQDWHRIAILNIIMIIFLIAVYSIGCCAFRNARRDGTYSPYGKPYV